MPAGVPCAELGQRQCVMRKAYQRCITAAASTPTTASMAYIYYRAFYVADLAMRM